MRKAPLAIGVAAMLLTLWAGTSAHADTGSTDMQDRIDAVLQEQPGGTQIAWNEVSWNDGDVVLTLASASTSQGVTTFAAVGGCTSGKFCAYNQTGYRGDKITYSTCTSSQSVSALVGPVRSIANSRTSGTIRAYAGSTLLATATAGTGANVTGTTTNITCG